MENAKTRSRIKATENTVRKIKKNKKEISALWIIYLILTCMIICGIGSCTNILTVMKGKGNQFHNSQETTTKADSTKINLNTK